jgi:hypothetical protein
MSQRFVSRLNKRGPSLIKGVIQQLSAIALSIKPGAEVELIQICGGLKTHGPQILPLEQLGSVRSLSIEGGCVREGDSEGCHGSK